RTCCYSRKTILFHRQSYLCQGKLNLVGASKFFYGCHLWHGLTISKYKLSSDQQAYSIVFLDEHEIKVTWPAYKVQASKFKLPLGNSNIDRSSFKRIPATPRVLNFLLRTS
ncbi:unnamed protein product, partial [Musa acuminata subsp. burmannicoides]